jgi:hypothetical protein
MRIHLEQIGRQFFHCFLLVALSLFGVVTTYCLATLPRLSSAKRVKNKMYEFQANNSREAMNKISRI